jgi:predicted RND superfamily exporter protein
MSLKGINVDEESIIEDNKFMMDMFELQEEIEEISQVKELMEIQHRIENVMQEMKQHLE